MTEPVYGLTEGAAKILQEMANEHRQRLPGVGRRTRRVWPQKTTTGGRTGVGGCGNCSQGAGVVDVTVTESPSFKASQAYEIVVFCAGVPIFIFADATGSGPVTWTGTVDPETVTCVASEVTFTATLSIWDHLPGDGAAHGALVTASDGASTWKWVNTASIDSSQYTEMKLISGPPNCPCAPLVEFPCLRPIPTPVEE